MTPQNWPDPKRPGVPMFPERDGWHWLSIGDASPIPIEWNADQSPVAFDDWGWALGDCDDDLHSPEKAAKSMRYHGPVLIPTQINEMLAAERAKERERIIAALDNSAKAAADDFTPMQHGALMAITQDIIEGIRNLRRVVS